MSKRSLPKLNLPEQIPLAVLAILGQADRPMLEAVLATLGSPNIDADGTVIDGSTLLQYPFLIEERGQFRLDAEARSSVLACLEQDHRSLFRPAHQAALAYLAGQLRTGNLAVEPVFVRVFDRLASRLLQDDPPALAQLLQSIHDIPLTSPLGQQLRRYLEGVALALADRYAEALAVFDDVLAEPELDEEIWGRALNSRAIYAYLTGRLQEAQAGYRASLEVWRRLGNRLREGMALLNLGILAYGLQEYVEAEICFRQASGCFEAAGSAHMLASVQNELGLLYRDQGRWAEALGCFESVVAQRRAEGAQDSLGAALNNLGETLLFQGRLQEAEAVFHQALATMQTRVFAVDVHINLGLVQQLAGEGQQALAAFQEALDLALAIERRDILALAHFRLGEAARRLGNHEFARRQFEAAAEVIETTREPLQDEALKISLLGSWQQVYESLVLHHLALNQPAVAFQWAERSRARAFADAVGGGDWRLEIGDRAGVVSLAEVQAALPPDTALLGYFTTGVLDRVMPMLRTLPANSPLRDSLLTPARTLLFVVTRDDLVVQECPVDPNAFASSSRRGGDFSRWLAPGALRQLYTSLLAPAGKALAGRRLYVIPHGPLHQVPFGALLDSTGQTLVRPGGPQVAYVPSATVLLRHCLAPGPRNPARRTCLAVGYQGDSAERILRHTEAEAEFVAGLTQGEAWIGPQPKQDRLRGAVGDYRWLHFACHGQFNHEAPLDSYLETGTEERVTAREVMQHWRLQADLVTLSACQTGLSRVLRGDEPMGFMRAFLAAGARAALVSQWPVEDLPAFLLMQRFYTSLQGANNQVTGTSAGFPGKSAGHRVDPAAGLHAAQLWLRELTAAEARTLIANFSETDWPAVGLDPLADLPAEARPFAHPRHWAAFILVGG